MKPKHLILLSAVTIAASSLTSCSYDEYELPAEEVYTRNFIKTFGLIDPAQDWNLAQNTAVTVRVGDKPSHVKAYMKVDGTYYIVANLENVSGNVNIPFDMPEGTSDILVKINDKPYYTTPGGTVDPVAPASRNILQDANNIGAGTLTADADGMLKLGESGTYAGITVNIARNEKGRAMTLSKTTMTEALERLPESDNGNMKWDDTNFHKATDNFNVTAKEFYLFPEYWSTSNSTANIIGIYWEVPAGTDGSETINVHNADGSDSTYTIIRVPVMQNPNSLIVPCTGTTTAVQHFTDIEGWDAMFDKLIAKYGAEKYKKETVDGTTKYYHVYKGKEDSSWLPVNWTYDESWAQAEGRDWNNEVGKEVCKLALGYIIDSGNGLAKLTGDLVEGEATDGKNTPNTGANFYKSYGIHITLSEAMPFGFYIQQGPYVMYSERKMNEAVTIDDDTRQPSYAATYVDGQDTEENDKRHLCFEDWYPINDSNHNWDLNDMIFRVYGFDHLKDNTMETGKLDDIDDPNDNPDQPNPPTPVVEEPYHWLLAVEDLGATDDFDFNDIVMGITAELTTEALPTGARTIGKAVTVSKDDATAQSWNKVTFTALAGGGTKAAYIFYNGYKLYPDGKENRSEWHQWFGTGDYSSTTMINTMGSGVNNAAGASCTIYFGSEGGGSDANYLFSVEKLGMGTGENSNAVDAHDKGFKIGIDNADAGTSMEISKDYFDTEDGYFVKPANPGEAPQMFLIPDRWNKNGANTGTSTYDASKWQWPVERQHIQGSYPRFKEWVADHSTNADWYKDTGKSVCRPTGKK